MTRAVAGIICKRSKALLLLGAARLGPECNDSIDAGLVDHEDLKRGPSKHKLSLRLEAKHLNCITLGLQIVRGWMFLAASRDLSSGMVLEPEPILEKVRFCR